MFLLISLCQISTLSKRKKMIIINPKHELSHKRRKWNIEKLNCAVTKN